MTFLNKIISACTSFPTRYAFCIQGRYYTYKDLASKIVSIQKGLNEKYKNEQKIGVVVNDSIEAYSSVLAILLSGKTYIPIASGYPGERIQQIIRQSGIKVVLSAYPGTAYSGVGNINTAGVPQPVNNSEISIPQFRFDNTDAYILFTSGSTGVPKGVPLSYYNLDSFVTAFFALGYNLDENSRVLQMFDLTFDLSVMSFIIPLCLGACVYAVSDNGMKYANVYTALNDYKITFALMVPSILSYLRPYFEEIQLPELRYSLFCGEALYKDAVTEWMKCVPNAIVENVYGPTEATIFCMAYSVQNESGLAEYNGIVSIGKAMEGMEAIIAGENGQKLTGSDKGELCLSGKQVTNGYLDAQNNKVFFMHQDKRYYRTGDVAFKDTEGNFNYCGRLDHQVKIQGFRVELSEIEFHLRNITGAVRAVAFVTNTFNAIPRIDVALEGEKDNFEDIIDQLKRKLPSYMIPSAVHFVSCFPLNANGKIDRDMLIKMITPVG